MIKRVLSLMLVAVLLCTVMPLQAMAATPMAASPECIEFIKQIEGFHAIPYWDYSQWTVGFGTACPDAFLSLYKRVGIPVKEAEDLMQIHIKLFNREINSFMSRKGISLTQQEYDAVFSLCYNMGAAWLYRIEHRLAQAIVNGTTGNELAYLWGLHSNAGDEFQKGLFKRRMMEVDMFLNGRYSNKMPVDYGSVTYDSGAGTCEAKMQGYDMHLPAQPLAVPTYAGHRFLGWYTKAEGGVLVTELNAQTNGMTLYAHWEKFGAADQITGTPVEDTLVTVRVEMLNVRLGPGTGYRVIGSVPEGTQLMIVAVYEKNGTIWGKCDQGWIPLSHTDYKAPGSEESDAKPEVELPMDATVMNVAGIAVYNGPHTSYPQVGTLEHNQQIQILELREFMGQQWGRIQNGWVRTEKDLMFHDQTLLAHSFVATITNSYLNVRTGPGTSYSLAGTLSQDDQVEIFAVAEMNSMVWGRCYQGWISLSYTDFDKTMLPRYRSHTFEEWYALEGTSCIQAGQERRDCMDCEHFEVRTAQKTDHSYGQWTEVTAPTQTLPGLERRECQVCGYAETRELERLQPEQTRVFGTVTGCAVLNVRAGAGSNHAWVGTLKQGDRVEILEQTTVDGKLWGRCEKGWFCITGYVTVEEVSEEESDRNIMTVTAYSLTIRADAGSGNPIVGYLKQGEQVEVLETKEVDGTLWARIDRGWVSTKYLK